jgi:predicted O-methyltransferase YrrM
MFRTAVKKIIRSVPVGRFLLEYRSVKGLLNAERVPPGHYYSAVPDLKELLDNRTAIFGRTGTPEGIVMHGDDQIGLLRQFAGIREEVPFYESPGPRRFTIENNSFSFDDAPVLAYMLRTIKPKRIIEVGSGNSTSCMLDINDRYFDGSVRITIIDIDINNPRMHLFAGDIDRISRIESPVQKVGKDVFGTLEKNDLLFIDSSHVMKTGSDVNTVLFEILPALNSGVYVHFHDILYPFEYTETFVKNRTFWNEAYAVRAFLMYSNAFRIRFWLNYLLKCHLETIRDDLHCLPLDRWKERFSRPDYTEAGGSLYLQKN